MGDPLEGLVGLDALAEADRLLVEGLPEVDGPRVVQGAVPPEIAALEPVLHDEADGGVAIEWPDPGVRPAWVPVSWELLEQMVDETSRARRLVKALRWVLGTP